MGFNSAFKGLIALLCNNLSTSVKTQVDIWGLSSEKKCLLSGGMCDIYTSKKLHLFQLPFLFKFVFTVFWQTPTDHNILCKAGTVVFPSTGKQNV
jgi:hypothetical protein